MQKQAYPYCVHGTYVGGCGADYMCGDCELGYEPPSLAELQAEARHIVEAMRPRLHLLAQFGQGAYAEPGFTNHALIADHLIHGDLRKLRRNREEQALIRRFTQDPDDRSWLWQLHEERVKEWEALEGEDQFWSLPDQVLDGA